MKLIHFSDTHLGFNDLDAVSEIGINQREADFYDTFRQVIDAILLEKPHYVIHIGNLVHHPSPSNFTFPKTIFLISNTQYYAMYRHL